jgi:hypothetical protein
MQRHKALPPLLAGAAVLMVSLPAFANVPQQPTQEKYLAPGQKPEAILLPKDALLNLLRKDDLKDLATKADMDELRTRLEKLHERMRAIREGTSSATR